MNSSTFYLEDDIHAENVFNGRIVNFFKTFDQKFNFLQSFQNFKNDSYCVGVRHRFARKNNNGDTTSNYSKILVGYCSLFNRKKSLTVSDNTIQAEGLGSLFKKFEKAFC